MLCLSFSSLQGIKVTFEFRHVANKPFWCKICLKAFKSQTALRCHERAHVNGKLRCSICPYQCEQKSHLNR